eukprot:gene28858-35795_t
MTFNEVIAKSLEIATSDKVYTVSAHDDVSAYIDHILNSNKRYAKAIALVNNIDEFSAGIQLDSDDVLLDPVGNTPLKIFRTTPAETSTEVAV